MEKVEEDVSVSNKTTKLSANEEVEKEGILMTLGHILERQSVCKV